MNDRNQDDQEKGLDPNGESTDASKGQGDFTRAFLRYNANSAPGITANPPGPTSVPSPPQRDPQTNQQSMKPPGEFTRFFNRTQVQAASKEFEMSREAEFPQASPAPEPESPVQPGTFTRVFGRAENPQLGQSVVRSVPPESVSLPQPEAVNPIFSNEKRSSPPLPAMRGPFQERSVSAMPEGGNDIFQPLQSSPESSQRRFAGSSIQMSPVIPEASVPIPSRQPATVFGDGDASLSDPNLNAVNISGGPSSYTKVVSSSAMRSSQESAQIEPAPQPPHANQMPPMQMPAMPQVAMMQMPQIPQPQMMQGAPMMPMVQMPTAPTLPQPAPVVVPRVQPSAQPDDSKWGPYMPLILGLNIFLLLAILLVVVVFLVSKK